MSGGVFVAGVSGNVGRMVALRVLKEGLKLAGGLCLEEGADVGELLGIDPLGMRAFGDLRRGLAETKPQVAVDFTSADVLEDHIKGYLEMGVPAVVGTTGLSADRIDQVRSKVAQAGGRMALISNFSLGVNLVMDFLKSASEHFPWASVWDLHHNRMANSPSGTAVSMAKLLQGGGEVSTREVVDRVLGGKVEGVAIHSERMPFPSDYSEHQILLGRPGEVIRIQICGFDSSIYVDGVMMAVRRVPELPPGTLVTSLGELAR
ncbi:Dihydrodipicolinate reductase [Thermanaerovibrio acidaminovorans DSM 6589]|uniref:4-hydroxy-tetrahydrodipicolinate reductase n=1 Tax=Thermanaerovibrio acidaminovorans (strain ATCC 49978 / DSM 6589 / Su883) TaxID=525903 RepID=D1B723_THEAS|nr:4-hydroxy-tetrahydrodipicolinate reductase [Thermanaerovibrio acidaminovorans]ACZ19814.1 Dihydrodipicolinate reductase [Thermanaerovibrio acidaminovorans DSM 6589]